MDDAVFGRVKPSNAFEETVERILQAIKLGVVAYGERLPPERELAARLGVSRVTLREAIRGLKQVGYLESRRGYNGGTFVIYRPDATGPINLADVVGSMGESLLDALKFRDVIEPGAVDLAARQQLTKSQVAQLRKLLDDVVTSPKSHFFQADSRFHLGIAELTGSTMVTRAVAEVRMYVNDLLSAIPLLDQPVNHSNEQHIQIVDAILRGDSAGARLVMQHHIDATASMLRGFLGSPPSGTTPRAR
jgi:GntR family transcriptional repressor for pyruvate dehydrogenase complex